MVPSSGGTACTGRAGRCGGRGRALTATVSLKDACRGPAVTQGPKPSESTSDGVCGLPSAHGPRNARGRTACATSPSSPGCRRRRSTGCSTAVRGRAPAPCAPSSRPCSTLTASRPSCASPLGRSCSTSSSRPRRASARPSGRRSRTSCRPCARPRSGRASTCARTPTSTPPSRCSTALGRRGRVCHGVVLKAPDDPAVASAVGRLAGRGIPVVTLVTDVRDSTRVAYVGLDNAAAGATAAYLVTQVLGDRPGDVLLTLSRSLFFGERERADAFTTALARLAPGRRVHTITDSDGLDATMGALVSDLLAAQPERARRLLHRRRQPRHRRGLHGRARPADGLHRARPRRGQPRPAAVGGAHRRPAPRPPRRHARRASAR